MEEIPIEAEGVRALFSPSIGMNMLSLQLDGVEVIDQSTLELFDKRSAGLGALIGPHFHRRKKEIVPKLDYSLFTKLTEGGDPFSHGVARYAPWTVTVENNQIKGILKGTDVWNGVKLADIEGGDFTMTYTARIEKRALELALSVVSQNDSLVGTHFYYRVPEGEAFVESHVNDTFICEGALKEIPEAIGYDPETKKLKFSLNHEADFTFHPYPDPLRGEIALHTREYTLNIAYESPSSENSWQLWKPKNSYVCIEPISSWDPRHPNLTVSSIKIRISREK